MLALITSVILMSSPVYAQTSDNILADARGEAVQVISTGIANVFLIVSGVLISLLAIALFALYRSAPPILQKIIVENGEKTLASFREWTQTTQTQWDDRVADVAIRVFEAVIGKIAETDDASIPDPTESVADEATTEY